jgi:hypothetical protein
MQHTLSSHTYQQGKPNYLHLKYMENLLCLRKSERTSNASSDKRSLSWIPLSIVPRNPMIVAPKHYCISSSAEITAHLHIINTTLKTWRQRLYQRRAEL